MELEHKGQLKKSPPDHLARRTLPESPQQKIPREFPDETNKGLRKLNDSEVTMHPLGAGVRYDPMLAANAFPRRTVKATTTELPSFLDPSYDLCPEQPNRPGNEPTAPAVEVTAQFDPKGGHFTPLLIKMIVLLLRSLGFLCRRNLKLAFGLKLLQRFRRPLQTPQSLRGKCAALIQFVWAELYRWTIKPLINLTKLGESQP